MKWAMLAAMALSVAGCTAVPPEYQAAFSARCVYGGSIIDWNPAGCLQKVKDQAAAKAAARAAAQRQLVASYGGPAGYAAHEARQAAKGRADTFRVEYSYCRSQMAAPATAFQDQWENDRCAAYARSLGGQP